MTVAADTVALNIIFEELLLNNIPNSRLPYKTMPYLQPKWPKSIPFMTKMAEKPYPLGPHIPI